MIDPSPESNSILYPGLVVIAVGIFALVSSLPRRVQVAGVPQLSSCLSVSPSCISDSQEEQGASASLQRLWAAGSIPLNRAGVSSECFQLVTMIKFPHIKSKVDFTFA